MHVSRFSPQLPGWARSRLRLARSRLLVFRLVHPSAELELEPARVASMFPGWTCVWADYYDYTPAGRFLANRVYLCARPGPLAHPALEGDYTDYSMVVCELMGHGASDVSGVAAAAWDYAAALVSPLAPYSSERGRPRPVGAEFVFADYPTGLRIELGSSTVACLSSEQCWGEVVEMLADEGREAAEFARALGEAFSSMLQLATDIETLAVRESAASPDPYLEGADMLIAIKENPSVLAARHRMLQLPGDVAWWISRYAS